ncbi:DUF6144 family protein [Roseimarinus sediminis]|uniref:DUF6144 family protein n=1 Tax=Roseimarinus sediminis TaxID=1610899 RepID=UPI003D19D05D
MTGACFCGFPALIRANHPETDEEKSKDTEITRQWISTLLKNVEDIGDEAVMRQLIKGCAVNHFKQLKMDQFLEPYQGNIEEFNQLIEKEWGWKIAYQKEKGILLADENKSYCVCPLLKPGEKVKYPALCYCSEGFAELMFSKVTGKPVRARVISSIHRGNDRCIYEISM